MTADRWRNIKHRKTRKEILEELEEAQEMIQSLQAEADGLQAETDGLREVIAEMKFQALENSGSSG